MRTILFFIVCFLVLSGCNPAASSSETEVKAPEFDWVLAQQNYQSTKETVAKLKKDRKLSERLREEIGLKAFHLQAIEIAEAQLRYQDKAILNINTAFFDGIPVGTKHWYCKAGQAVAVEIAAYEQDEEGALVEKLLYTLIFNKDMTEVEWKALSTELTAEQKALILKEQQAEWTVIKALADKYQPKDKKEQSESES